MGFDLAATPPPPLDVARRRIDDIRDQLTHTASRLTATEAADPRVMRAITEAADVVRGIEAARRSVSRDSEAP